MYYNNFSQRKHEVMLETPSGLLEGVIYKVSNLNTEKLALVLPPDPYHKGTMNNRIVNMLFEAFQYANFTTLKINYKGVGKSKGKSNTQEEKISDALIALDWLIKKCESNDVPHPKICLAGFSLGGWIALHCAMRRPEITNFITINTSFDTADFNMLTPCPSGLMVQAENDILVKPDTVEKFSSQLITQKGCSVQQKIINDNHYFTKKFVELKNLINMYVKNISKENTYNHYLS